ncbi:hypothetical protein [Desertivibrio insolitus]|uniref:hypothetical protein n=1 Tax=Herbiconiux sp. SYSU D00978 TaxID=2812562 RepID=UPI001A973EE8|nr:hypothetical protein [Herbiconiux sp. SYSU D00978]
MFKSPLLRARLLAAAVALAGVIAGLAAAEPAYAKAAVSAPSASTAVDGIR